MNRLAAAILAASALAGATAAPVPASAQVFFGLSYGQNVSQGDCKGLAASLGPRKVWFSRFSGSKPDVWDRGLEPAWGVGCFRTQQECKRWLYNTQTEWPRLMNFTRCAQGLPARF
ncbi:hypothetical protein OSH10_16945 [Kaistia defluvii]|uniref:hypothetical protein n=1 Tax=Kaistia defluvii TaxID=410841 RepID=UPI00224FE5CF|nr:hypothetical protein [Kaistia defluvii]MCX5520131.1 hypothetical protein [Kaistia defluvii]